MKLDAYPGQCHYVQSVLKNEAGLQHLVLRDLKEVPKSRPYKGMFKFSPFAQTVASALWVKGVNPRQAGVKRIILTAVEISKIAERVQPVRVIHLGSPDGHTNYVEHLHRQIKEQEQIIGRAADKIDELRKKIKDVKALRS
jgi:hypothetical protein